MTMEERIEAVWMTRISPTLTDDSKDFRQPEIMNVTSSTDETTVVA